jgi:hypothetical protein
MTPPRQRLDAAQDSGGPTHMRYRIGDKSVWRVGYGAMQLAGDGVFGPPRDRGEAIAVLRAALDAGVDHIDTAQYYGPGVVNQLIREALFPYPDKLALISKVAARRDGVGAVVPHDDPDQLRAGIEDNLAALGGSRAGRRLDRRNRDQQRNPTTPAAGAGGHRHRLRSERLQPRGSVFGCGP